MNQIIFLFWSFAIKRPCAENRITVWTVKNRIRCSVLHNLRTLVLCTRDMYYSKVIMQGKLFQRGAHLLYGGVLSVGGNVNIMRMKPDMGSIFYIKNQWNILVIVIGIYYENYKKVSKFNSFNILRYLTNTDASIIVYKFRPERTGFNLYAEYMRLQLTSLAL